MSDQWFAIVEKATGRLHSTGTVIADAERLQRDGLEALPLDFNPQLNKEWDQASRTFKDRLPRILTPFEIARDAVDKLTIADRAQLKALL